MLKNKKILIIIGVLLLLVSGLVFALPPRVSWSPNELKPISSKPNTIASYTVTLKHTGILPIPATNQLKITAEGNMIPFVTITQPTFPSIFKKGNQVKVIIKVIVPKDTPMRVVTGNLLLSRILPNGKVMEVWRAEALPVELTFSTLLLPPDPGVVGKATVVGIDTDKNGVRDDIDRYIAFTYPNSEKERMELIQYAKEDQKFVADFLALANDPVEQKRVTRVNVLERDKAQDCLYYSFGDKTEKDFIVGIKKRETIESQFLNTTERQTTYLLADELLGGMVSGPTLEEKAQCKINPDTLPN